MDLFVNEPFALGHCLGVLPYLVTDQHLSPKERVYIYALERFRQLTDYPVELHQEANNQRIYGNLPEDEELPINVLLGSVDVVDIWPGTREIGEDERVYRVTNAHLFVAPFEIQPNEIEENAEIIKLMPTNTFFPRVPSLCDGGREFLCPTNDFMFDYCLNDGDVNLDLSPALSKLLLDDEGNLKPISKLTLWNGRWAKSYLVDDDTQIVFREGQMDELVRCPRIFPETDNLVGAMVHFSCHHPLND